MKKILLFICGALAGGFSAPLKALNSSSLTDAALVLGVASYTLKFGAEIYRTAKTNGDLEKEELLNNITILEGQIKADQSTVRTIDGKPMSSIQRLIYYKKRLVDLEEEEKKPRPKARRIAKIVGRNAALGAGALGLYTLARFAVVGGSKAIGSLNSWVDAKVDRVTGLENPIGQLLNVKDLPSMNDIVGYDEIKQQIQEAIINPVGALLRIDHNSDAADFAIRHNLKPGFLLLYGPPGTGKSMFLAAVAKKLHEVHGLDAISLDGADVMSKWVGETEANIKALIEYVEQYYARTGKPLVVTADEVESLLGKRVSGIDSSGTRLHNSVVALFLQKLEGVTSCAGKLILLAATNDLQAVDPAIVDRFAIKIYIPTPNAEMQNKVIEDKLGKLFVRLKDDPAVQIADEVINFDGKPDAGLVNDLVAQVANCRAIRQAIDRLNHKLLAELADKKHVAGQPVKLTAQMVMDAFVQHEVASAA